MKNIILTKDELIIAFREWTINVENNPESFQGSSNSLEDATICVEYLLQLIDKNRNKS